jgi:hypothetical protein
MTGCFAKGGAKLRSPSRAMYALSISSSQPSNPCEAAPLRETLRHKARLNVLESFVTMSKDKQSALTGLKILSTVYDAIEGCKA